MAISRGEKPRFALDGNIETKKGYKNCSWKALSPYLIKGLLLLTQIPLFETEGMFPSISSP